MGQRDGGPQSWSTRAVRYVTSWQERAWGDVGQQLGLGWDPAAAFEQLSREIPDGDYFIQRIKEQLGPQLTAELYAGGHGQLEHLINEYIARYFIDPPTPFEEPLLQSTLMQLLDEARPVIEESGYELTARPLVATIPSSSVHARTRSIPWTDEAVVLFQHGLMLFLRDFAKVLAVAMPFSWLGLAVGRPDGIHGQPGNLDNVALAGSLLADSMVAFVVDGSARESPYIELAGHAQISANMLLHHMELGVLCHELMHLLLGHLLPIGEAPTLTAWEKEYDADQVASTVLVSATRRNGSGLGDVEALWIYELSLAALDLVERARSYLTVGAIDGPPNETHPPPRDRRRELMRRNAQGLMESHRLEAAVSLERRTAEAGQLIEDLWLSTKPTWDSLRQKAVEPSPIWNVAAI